MRVADVVVVGAGVLGCSIALELARDGRTVLVVDRNRAPGQGSTSASSAIVRFNYSTWDGVATAWEAQHGWVDWAEHLGGVDPDGMARFRRTGLAMLDVDLAPRARVTPMFDRAQIPYEHWDAARLEERLPWLQAGRHWPPRRLDDPAFWKDPTTRLGALWTPDAGYVDDPSLAAVNLAHAAQREGATFVLGRQVVEVLGDSETAGVRLDDGTTLSAPIVVNVAGPWSAALNRLAGVGADWTVSLRPLRQEVHQVPFAPTDTEVPVVADLDVGTYFRSTPGGALLLGGTEPECDPLEWLDDPDAANPHPTSEGFSRHVTRVARRLPGLGVPPRPLGIAGVYDVTEDWAPVYDRTERDGFFVAVGTSGNQFKNAPVVGLFLAALLRGETTVTGAHTGLTIDLRAYRRDRPRNPDSTGTVMG